MQSQTSLGSYELLTIGHGTRSQHELVAMLKAAEVTDLVDLRGWPPLSRHNPQFNGGCLYDVLQKEGIEWHLIQALSGRRPRTLAPEESPNGWWDNESFRNFADYMLTDEFARGFDALAQIMAKGRPAIMCGEAVWWRCHRRLIANYATAEGLSAGHIMGVGKVTPSVLPACVRIIKGERPRLYYAPATEEAKAS